MNSKQQHDNLISELTAQLIHTYIVITEKSPCLIFLVLHFFIIITRMQILMIHKTNKVPATEDAMIAVVAELLSLLDWLVIVVEGKMNWQVD